MEQKIILTIVYGSETLALEEATEQVVTLCTCILEMPGWNLGRNTG
jgi:hypothetical protein